MSRPPLNPTSTPSGITLDPQSLERVIPESKRPDGTVRKQLKIRPGFTPQEDVRRFRGTRQAQMDANQLPKGHIIGWAPPASAAKEGGNKPMSKSAKKNAKRREKKKEDKEVEDVPENWDDDEGEKTAPATSTKPTLPAKTEAKEDALAASMDKLKV